MATYRKSTTNIDIWIGTCEKCKREFASRTLNQAKWNMITHRRAEHGKKKSR